MEPSKSYKRPPRIFCNLSDTQYEVIHQVISHDLGWQIVLTEEEDDSNLVWTDHAVLPERLSRLKLYQKINHFPGMHAITRKNHLAWNLQRMQKALPSEFDFFPKTWVLPSDANDLRNSAQQGALYIVKPEASSQGRGIFLTRNPTDINMSERLVVQEYIPNPFLIGGLKFDLRVYVLITGVDPLRIFVHEDGLTRFATERYSTHNIQNLCVHLTNYAINKSNPKFVFNTDAAENVGHKRTLESTFAILESKHYDVYKIKKDIYDIIIKTLCAASSSLSHVYKACQSEDVTKSMCFQVLGFDIILDSNLKPWLLEVNHSPSFQTDTPLDWQIKRKLIHDTLVLVDIKARYRKQYFMEQTTKSKERVQNVNYIKETKEAKQNAYKAAQAKRTHWEDKHLGGFTRVYPTDEMRYRRVLEIASKIWIEFTGKSKNIEVKSVSKVVIGKKPPRRDIVLDHQNTIEFPQIKKTKASRSDYGYTEQALSTFSKYNNRARYLKSKSEKSLKTSSKSLDTTKGSFIAPVKFEFKCTAQKPLREVSKLAIKNPNFSNLAKKHALLGPGDLNK